jgi:hypothetical protein
MAFQNAKMLPFFHIKGRKEGMSSIDKILLPSLWVFVFLGKA